MAGNEQILKTLGSYVRICAVFSIDSIVKSINKIADLQQFEIWINLTNKDRKFIVLMVLREVQNHKNNKEFFSYFELLADLLSHGVFFQRWYNLSLTVNN